MTRLFRQQQQRRLSRSPSQQHSTVPSCCEDWKMMIAMVVMLILGCGSVWPVASAEDTNTNCAMDIWIFSSFESCQASDAPVANGKIYADGQCRTIETDLDPSVDDPTNFYTSFPGNYRVQCIDTNKIRFTDSACLDQTCSVSTTVAEGGNTTTAVCDRDNASPASLYSRLLPPEYVVQDPANANVGAFYTCLKLGSADVLTLTFVVFGDCSQCNIIVTPPTAAPIVLPSTPSPVVSVAPATTTSPVTTPSTTLAPAVPSVAPTMTNVTTNMTTAVPSVTPSRFPVLVPTVAPVVTPAPIVVTAPTDTAGLVHDIISVAIQLSPMNTTIASSVNSIWEDVTMDQIRSVADVYQTIIYATDISNVTQSIIDLTAGSTVTRRSLQQEDNVTTISIGTTKSRALQIMFDVSMSYTPSSSTTTTTLADLFTASFDSEQDRSNYLIKLVTNDDIFTSVRLVQVLYVNGTNTTGPDPNNPQIPQPPVAAPTTQATANSDERSSSSSTALLVALAGGGTALIVFAIFGIVFYQRQQQHKHNGGSNGSSKAISTNEGETPSDNDEYYGGGPVGPLNFSNNHHHSNSPASQQQRWTNEIIVDPSADDVSTLGGSVLLGYLDPTTANPNNNNKNTGHAVVEDEPTASVNLDFDYNNNQYRSDLEDRSRTVFTETTGPTTFTNFTSKLGMNGDGMFSDDASFDELYAEIDDAANDTTHDTIVREPSHQQQQQQHLNKIASMVQPFEVRVPPGKLGMVVDTPNGGVPVVRAIRPDSVLHGTVLVGDRLISVDNKDVTNLTALEVSSLISLKKDQPERLMVFCRLQPGTTTPPTAFAPSSGSPP